MNLTSIPAGVPFLPALAELWRVHCGASGHAPHDGLILLPTRRAARGLATAFLDAAGQKSLLLPRIVALGALDEAPLALAGALTVAPAIIEPHRRAVLAQLILQQPEVTGAPRRADAAWKLAGDLAGLMDEAERAEIDLAEALHRAAEPAQAAHWQRTLEFLQIVTRAWPAHLAEQNLLNPAARQVALLDAQAGAWAARPPVTPVMAVSAGADIPAVGRLLKVIAALPHGHVVLPGLDHDLPERVWAEQLDEAHPQHGVRATLSQLNAQRGDVTVHGQPADPGRASLLRRALLPAAALGAWQTRRDPRLAGLTRLAAADVHEEAVAIAMRLRDALETPGARAALVTPDRGLAERVTAELARWGVVADDSAGEALGQTPPAVFLRLIAAVADQRFAPVALLALLKHPLAAAALPAAELRRRARALERRCLRGPAPQPGLSGLRRAIDATRRTPPDDTDADLADLLARLETCLQPIWRARTAAAIPPVDLLTRLIESAEALAATDETGGPARLWAGEDGEALATLLGELLDALPALPAGGPECLPGLLDALLEGAVVRSRRALRGRPGGAEHPRIFIWGLLEARLQDADVIVLGGLNEGVWPPATDPGPWMSRPMRIKAGLPSPELRIGQAAHDFCMAACAATQVVLSAPRRRDNAPAVPSRWLARLEAMLGHAAWQAMLDPAAHWPAQLDQPAGGIVPAPPPRPCPPLTARPRRLAVTDIATLLRNPYEIYARRILDLDRLDPLEQSTDFFDYGNIVHRGLDAFVKQAGTAWPADAVPRIAAALEQALRGAGVRSALIAWWLPRLRRIAVWVDDEERTRRALHPPAAIATERSGVWHIDRPGGRFTLAGRADRIERRADGRLAILDYKTGTLPTRQAALDGHEPQLLLEAAMIRAGAFGPDYAGPVAEMTYWRLTGEQGDQSGRALSLLPDATQDGIDMVIAHSAEQLAAIVDRYDDPATPYPAQPLLPRARPNPYAQLSRAAEWGAPDDAALDNADEADA